MFTGPSAYARMAGYRKRSVDSFKVERQRGFTHQLTIERMTTHGKLRAATIFMARDVFPDPLEPAIPIILGSRRQLSVLPPGLMREIRHEYWPMGGCSGPPEQALEASLRRRSNEMGRRKWRARRRCWMSLRTLLSPRQLSGHEQHDSTVTRGAQRRPPHDRSGLKMCGTA